MESDCQPSPAVAGKIVMQIILPYTIEAFTAEVQENLKIGIAAACSAGCKCQISKWDVNITGAFEARRRVLVARPPDTRRSTNGIKVDLAIGVPSIEAGGVLVPYLTKGTINQELKKAGVEPITAISRTPEFISAGSGGGDSALSVGVIVGLIIAGIAVVMMLGFGVFYDYLRRNKVAAELASGLKWKKTGATKPAFGQELTDNPELGIALTLKTNFTQEEWVKFGIRKLRYDNFIESGGFYYKPAAEDEVLSPELRVEVREAVEKALAEGQGQDGRMMGGLKDFKSGKFQDAAKGIKSFIGVPKSWLKGKECTIDGIIAEVKRLCNCPDCAAAQASVLADMKRDKEAELTRRLATELSGLLRTQENENPSDENEKPIFWQKKMDVTRSEIEADDGWVYGSNKSTAVSWPDDSVTHEWGKDGQPLRKYGQPMCPICKELCLDFSTIWADLHYILYEKASNKQCFNGIRDSGHTDMEFADFMKLKEVLEAGLSEAELCALRFYTSHSFGAINTALRKRHQPHPLPATVMCVNDGLKSLRGNDAESDDATAVIEFFRGFTDMQVTQDFKSKGGTEQAPMSTTTDCRVACGYAVRKRQTNGALLMKIVTSNNLQRGADLTFLSMFPDEAETLFPPLTFVQPTGKVEEMDFKNGNTIFKLTIVEVTTTLP